MTDTRSILLTGASGVVGRALLHELDGITPYCLVHRTPVDHPGAVPLYGDLGEERFGLSRLEYDQLARRVDAVVHCAAITDFTVDQRGIWDMNVAGTERVLDFAAKSDARLLHVSTAFVARRAQTREGEGTSAYIGSKLAAERKVRDCGLPAVIVRPSIVMGDSQSGEIAQFQGLHALAGAVLRNALPIMPLRRQSRIDFVPQDLVAREIAALLRSGRSGGDHWITAGERAPTLGTLMDRTLRWAAGMGLSIHRPRMVDSDFVERLMLPVFLTELPEKGQRQFHQMLQLVRLFEPEDAFPSSVGEVGDLPEAFLRSMRYWAERKGLVGVAGAVA